MPLVIVRRSQKDAINLNSPLISFLSTTTIVSRSATIATASTASPPACAPTAQPESLTPSMPVIGAASITQPSEDYIFALGTKKRVVRSECGHNPTTSKMKGIEAEEALEELGYRVPEVKELSAKAIYGDDLYLGRAALSFLKMTESGYDYDQGIWTELSSSPASEATLRKSLLRIMNAIDKYFATYPSAGATREAVDSHDIPMVHDNGSHYTSPAISIRATGPSFEVPEHARGSRGLGYTNVAAVVEVKLDVAKGKRMKHCQRLAVFNR